MDVWAQVRSLGLPAGCASVSLLATMIEGIAKAGFGGIQPVLEALDAVGEAFATFKEEVHIFHPGATWMFGVHSAKTLAVEDIKSFVGILGNYFVASGKHPSLVAPPHIREFIANNP
eukprot:3610704-Amphidinium_carterae.1